MSAAPGTESPPAAPSARPLPRLSPPPLPFDGRRALLRVLLLSFVAAVVFAAIVRADRVVSGRGVLTGLDERVDVRTPIGGVVEAALVGGRESVRAGQVLLRLDGTEETGRLERTRADIAQSEREMAGLKAALSAVEAARRGGEPLAAADEKTSDALLAWRAARMASEEAARRERDVLPKERALAESRIEARRASAEAARATFAKAGEDLRGLATLEAKGINDPRGRRDAELARDQAKGRLAEAEAQAREEERRLSLLEAGGGLERDGAVARLASAVARLGDEASRLAAALARLEAGRAALEADLRAAESALRNRTIRATVDGLVVSAAPLGRGDRVEAGAAVCSIASTRVAGAHALFANRDAGRLAPGMPCRVKLDAFPFEEYGVLRGRIESIALEPEDDAKTGDSHYSAWISLERLGAAAAESRAPGAIRPTPWLALTVEVVTERPRLLSYLFEPLRRLSGGAAGGLAAPRSEGDPAEGAAPAPARPGPPRPATPFDADRAFSDLGSLVAIGPRPAGSPGLEAARAYVRSELERAGLSVEEERFAVESPTGRLALVNVYGRAGPALPSEARRPLVILGAHLDTKRIEAVPGFVGANDGASGAAVLLECARVLASEDVEDAVELHCALALDLDAEALARLLSKRGGQPDDGREVDGVSDPTLYKPLWGRWWGKQREFYLACGEVTGRLAWPDVEAIGGAQVRARARALLHAQAALEERPLPAALRLGKIDVSAAPVAGLVRIIGYSGNDALDVPDALVRALVCFDGRPTSEALARIAAEEEVELDEPLLRALIDYEVLVPVVA